MCIAASSRDDLFVFNDKTAESHYLPDLGWLFRSLTSSPQPFHAILEQACEHFDADESEGQDKFKLMAGRTVDLPKGITLLKFAAKNGSPTFSVVPVVT